MDTATETPTEATARMMATDVLIAVYVPEAETLSYQDALDLALARDLEAATLLKSDITG